MHSGPLYAQRRRFQFFYYFERYGFAVLIAVLFINANTGFMSAIVMKLWAGMDAILFSHFQPVPVSVEPWHMKSISASSKVR